MTRLDRYQSSESDKPLSNKKARCSVHRRCSDAITMHLERKSIAETSSNGLQQKTMEPRTVNKRVIHRQPWGG